MKSKPHILTRRRPARPMRDEADAPRDEFNVAREQANVARNEANVARNEANVARDEANVARDEANVARDEAGLLATEYRTFLAREVQKCQELEAAVARYADLFDFAPVGHGSFDRKGIICDINLQGARLLRRERKKLIGCALAPLLAKADRPKWWSLLARLRAGEAEPSSVDVGLARRRGPSALRIHASSSGHEMVAAHSREFFRAALVDISAQVEAESGLQRARRDLERRVFERTAQLGRAQEQLYSELIEREKLQRQIAAVGDQERLHLGQDLHDGLCQLLAGIRLKLESLRKNLADTEPAMAKGARAISALISRALDEARALAHGLEPVADAPGGLAVALQRLVASTRQVFGIRCSLDIPQPVPVPNQTVATNLFRIAQESVSNSIKHGKSKNIRISLTRIGDGLEMIVANDGLPFRETADFTGMGLKIMRDRARRIGATVDLRPGPRRGLLMSCFMPAIARPAPSGGAPPLTGALDAAAQPANLPDERQGLLNL